MSGTVEIGVKWGKESYQVAVDLSGSMQARDFSLPGGELLDRLQAVKQVLRELARQRESDRLGLIVFGDAAYLQTPFSDDHAVWTQLLEETEIGMAGQSTVFGDAIGLAIKNKWNVNAGVSCTTCHR